MSPPGRVWALWRYEIPPWRCKRDIQGICAFRDGPRLSQARCRRLRTQPAATAVERGVSPENDTNATYTAVFINIYIL